LRRIGIAPGVGHNGGEDPDDLIAFVDEESKSTWSESTFAIEQSQPIPSFPRLLSSDDHLRDEIGAPVRALCLLDVRTNRRPATQQLIGNDTLNSSISEHSAQLEHTLSKVKRSDPNVVLRHSASPREASPLSSSHQPSPCSSL